MPDQKNMALLSKKIKLKALELGFVKAGITDASDFTTHFQKLSERPEYDFFRKDVRDPLSGTKPKDVYPNAQSIISVAYSYGHIRFPENLVGTIGRAYQARCYNPPAQTMNGARITLFKQFLADNGITVFNKILVPDRVAAARAGVVSYGKNNFAYADEYGSFIILRSFVVDTLLTYDASTEHCTCPENCRICIDACPTGAILKPGYLNPHKCIAFNNWNCGYLDYPDTRIPYDTCEKIGSRVHGCDVCQEVCPRNKKALQMPKIDDPFLNTLAEKFHLGLLLILDDNYYQDVVKPIMYNYIKDHSYFKRNAAIAIGNSSDLQYLPYLKKALSDPDPIVREYTVWAIKKLMTVAPQKELQEMLSWLEELCKSESSKYVRQLCCQLD